MNSQSNISIQEIQKAQSQWSNSNCYCKLRAKEDYRSIAEDLVDRLYSYNYEENIVLFKPTLATEIPFRKTKPGALSYFIGDNINFSEDKGFALRPEEG